MIMYCLLLLHTPESSNKKFMFSFGDPWVMARYLSKQLGSKGLRHPLLSPIVLVQVVGLGLRLPLPSVLVLLLLAMCGFPMS